MSTPSRLRIQKQLEKSLQASSLILTDSNNEAGYLAPGAEGQYLRIVGGAVQYANGEISTFSISDGSTTQTVSSGDTVLFQAGDGLSVLVAATDEVIYSLKVSADQGNDIRIGSDGGVFLSKNNLVKEATWNDITNNLELIFDDNSVVSVPIIDNIGVFLSDFSISDGVTTTLINNHGTVTYTGNNLIKVTVTGATVTVGIDPSTSFEGQVLVSTGPNTSPQWQLLPIWIREEFTPADGDTTITLGTTPREGYVVTMYRNGLFDTDFTIDGAVITPTVPFGASPGAAISESVTVEYYLP